MKGLNVFFNGVGVALEIITKEELLYVVPSVSGGDEYDFPIYSTVYEVVSCFP